MSRIFTLTPFGSSTKASQRPLKGLCSVCAIGSYLARKSHTRPIVSVARSLHVSPRGCEFTSRTSSPLETTSEDEDLDSGDEDDVLILSDETSSVTRGSSLCAASSPTNRARSLGDMDLDSPQMIPTIPPEFSHTTANSSTSSLLSLTPPPFIPPPSSREEKAIAALTLALASGAAGLNDYGAVREALSVSAAHADGASEVGEMWR
jgi:hypothetical protein